MSSSAFVLIGDTFQGRIGIWKCWFLRRGENRSTQGKTSRSREENQQQTVCCCCYFNMLCFLLRSKNIRGPCFEVSDRVFFVLSAAIFVVTFVLLGFSLSIAVIVTFTVSMIIVDLLGLMYIWNISLNAMSLVNLVMVCSCSEFHCVALKTKNNRF